MIKLVIFDFDGVFNNGKIIISPDKNILKTYNVKDGMGIKLLKSNNIKVGMISGYKENESQRFIAEHLGMDHIIFGSMAKVIDLEKLRESLGIELYEIAYMGDDINDIEVMKIVGLSGCPMNAHEDCLKICNYIATKAGGDGCVREFCDHIIKCRSMDIVKSTQTQWEGSGHLVNNQVNLVNPEWGNDSFDQQLGNKYLKEIYNELNYQINNQNIDELHEFAEIIKTHKQHNIYFMGIGKSGNISKHCADMLRSISYNTLFLDTTNALHGDIGNMTHNDLVILFSKSGNTVELLEIIPFIKERKVQLIGICCDKNSKFKEVCDIVIETPFQNELSGEINKIPTNSIMSHVIFCNILVSILKNTITIEQYKENHPAGTIGKHLKKIKDMMITEFPKINIENIEECNIHNTLLEMTKYKLGCCFYVNSLDELIGILTDGDIRRLLLTDKYENINIHEHINRDYDYETDVNKFMKDIKYGSYLPIKSNNKIIGIIIQIN